MPEIIDDPTPEEHTALRCSACGNTDTFTVHYFGITKQPFRQCHDGTREYESGSNEVHACTEYQYTCQECDHIVAERTVTVTAQPWQAVHRAPLFRERTARCRII